MATLLFYDAAHRYELDGEELPSVSEIIRFISREIYGTVGQYTLDHAADRGTKIHKLCENLDRYGEVEVPEDLTGYLQAYVKFSKEHTVEWDAIEVANHHPELRYAGRIDRIGLVDGLRAIVDIKSSYVIHKPLVGAQLNLYRMIWEANGCIPIDRLYTLHLKPDGMYKLIDIPIDDTVAVACLTLHNALRKKPRKKKGDESNA